MLGIVLTRVPWDVSTAPIFLLFFFIFGSCVRVMNRCLQWWKLGQDSLPTPTHASPCRWATEKSLPKTIVSKPFCPKETNPDRRSCNSSVPQIQLPLNDKRAQWETRERSPIVPPFWWCFGGVWLIRGIDKRCDLNPAVSCPAYFHFPIPR